MKTFFTAALLCLSGASATAATLDLTPSTASGAVGTTLSLTVATSADAGDFTGFGFDVAFDPLALTYLGADFPAIFSFNNDQLASAADGLIDNITGSTFGVPQSGATELATLKFEVLTAGDSIVALQVAGLSGFGFANGTVSVPNFVQTYDSTAITGTATSPIPLPAGMWLYLAALASGAAMTARRGRTPTAA